MKPENVKCPECDGPMVSRLNREKNQRFWGCKAYPDCKGTRDTDGMSRQEREAERGRRV
jgi:ssDNA-binding Zn-finger/Zn-ribbon topoisomerase 1